MQYLQSYKYLYTPWITTALLVVALLLTFSNVFGPLRLNTDAIRYLGILEYLNGNLPETSSAAKDFFPHGYPEFLRILEKCHLLSSITITIVNILSVIISGAIFIKLFKIENIKLYYILILLSFVNIKEYALPISDQLFTLLFSIAIYLWTITFDKRLYYYIIPALLFTFLSIYVRTAGITIIGGVIFYLLYANKDSLVKYKKIVLTATLFLVTIIALLFIENLSIIERKVDYVKQLNLEELTKNPLLIFARLLVDVKELGELTINIPYSKLSSILKNETFSAAILCLAGFICFYRLLITIKKLKPFSSPYFWIFCSYLVMVFVWPFYDTRFLTPVIPILIYFLFNFLFSSGKIAPIKIALLGLYLAFGVVSSVYSSAISLNKNFFISHYGFDPVLTKKYSTHFQNQTSGKTDTLGHNLKEDPVIYWLQKYDRSSFIIKH